MHILSLVSDKETIQFIIHHTDDVWQHLNADGFIFCTLNQTRLVNTIRLIVEMYLLDTSFWFSKPLCILRVSKRGICVLICVCHLPNATVQPPQSSQTTRLLCEFGFYRETYCVVVYIFAFDVSHDFRGSLWREMVGWWIGVKEKKWLPPGDCCSAAVCVA